MAFASQRHLTFATFLWVLHICTIQNSDTRTNTEHTVQLPYYNSWYSTGLNLWQNCDYTNLHNHKNFQSHTYMTVHVLCVCVYMPDWLTLLLLPLGLVLAAPSPPPDLFLSSPGRSLLRARRFDEPSASFSLPDLSVSIHCTWNVQCTWLCSSPPYRPTFHSSYRDRVTRV